MLAFLLMGVVISLPLILLVSIYQLKTLMTTYRLGNLYASPIAVSCVRKPP